MLPGAWVKQMAVRKDEEKWNATHRRRVEP